jgi:hypothetical protein
MFQALKLVSQALEHMYQSLELMYHVLEYKIPKEENTFSPRKKNILFMEKEIFHKWNRNRPAFRLFSTPCPQNCHFHRLYP